MLFYDCIVISFMVVFSHFDDFMIFHDCLQ